MKKFAYLCFSILVFFDKIFKILTKRSVLLWLKEFSEERSYTSIEILENKKVRFFTPNYLTKSSVINFNAELETLEWINNFEKKKNLIFWDIGANIGLYSIYNSFKNPNSITYAFEPSSSNIRILTRNISINNLEKNIMIIPNPLTNKENIFQQMNENQFVEGAAFNTFGEKFNFEGKEFKPIMKYNLLGTTMNYFIKNSILDIPDYIKIDVDGIEHLILEGGDKFLKNEKVKSVSIEINENFKEQYEKVLNLMDKYEFKILHKKHNNEFAVGKYKSVYNYLFVKQNRCSSLIN